MLNQGRPTRDQPACVMRPAATYENYTRHKYYTTIRAVMCTPYRNFFLREAREPAHTICCGPWHLAPLSSWTPLI